MATKTKAAANPNEVAVPRSVLEQFISLVEGLEQADRTYQNCQSTLFRNYARGAYKSNNILTAVNAAKAALNAE